jgi:hypothetical protein
MTRQLESTGNTTDAVAFHRQRLADGAACFAAALHYLRRGWSVLALCPPDHAGVGKAHGKNCKSPGKAPWGPWKDYQARLPTEDDLRRKWHVNPTLNVGMALGPVSGLVRVDLDSTEAEERLSELSADSLPITLEFRRGSDSRGLLYAIPEGVTLRTTVEPFVSGELRFQAIGAQTVLPPSRHASGDLYEWVPGRGPGEIEPVLMPDWMVDLLRVDKAPKQARSSRCAPSVTDGQRFAEGSRNSTLTSLAGTMRRRSMTREAIEAALLAENEARCDPPLEEDEVCRIARSVAGYAPAVIDTAPSASGRRPAAAIILEHLREVYSPSFRRGDHIWSSSLAAEVRRHEALARGGDSTLMAGLTHDAQEMPRDDRGEPRPAAAPRVYRDWAPVAWADLLAELPDEPAAEEVDGTAEEQFRRRLSAALTRIITLASHRQDTSGEQEREARSILHWCLSFARRGGWAQIRSFYVWCRLDCDSADRHAALRVAIRPELLGQLGLRELAEIGQNRLADLCERYGVGRRCRVGRGGQRAIELSPEWLQGLLESPLPPDGDEVTGHSRARACVGSGVTPSPENSSP